MHKRTAGILRNGSRSDGGYQVPRNRHLHYDQLVGDQRLAQILIAQIMPAKYAICNAQI